MWNNTQNYQDDYQAPLRTKQNVINQLTYLAQQMHQPVPKVLFSDNVGGYLYNGNLGLNPRVPYTIELPNRMLFCSEQIVQGVLGLIIGRRANLSAITRMRKQLYILLGCLVILAIIMMFHIPALIRILLLLIYLACYSIFPKEYHNYVYKGNIIGANIIGKFNIIKALEYEAPMLKQDTKQQVKNASKQNKLQDVSTNWVNKFTQFIDISPEEQIEKLNKVN